MESINYLAVLVAAVSTFAIGGLWYSPLLFQRVWMNVNKLTESDLGTVGQGKIFALSFLFALVMAFNLAMFLNAPDTTLAWGVTAGALAAIWVALGIGTVALFERRPPAYIAINGGYWLVSFVVMGAILGAWR
ncbi:DUF1761 domain-containing protein [soil metagenome]